jgi:hypothetical protein
MKGAIKIMAIAHIIHRITPTAPPITKWREIYTSSRGNNRMFIKIFHLLFISSQQFIVTIEPIPIKKIAKIKERGGPSIRSPINRRILSAGCRFASNPNTNPFITSQIAPSI